VPWINDVAPNQAIASSWGNGVRNQIVQSFTSVAERNLHTSIPDGSLVYCADVDIIYMRKRSNPDGWRVIVAPWTVFNSSIQIQDAQNGSGFIAEQYITRYSNGYRVSDGSTLKYVCTLVVSNHPSYWGEGVPVITMPYTAAWNVVPGMGYLQDYTPGAGVYGGTGPTSFGPAKFHADFIHVAVVSPATNGFHRVTYSGGVYNFAVELNLQYPISS
jgi:hypothetical protein